MDAPDLMARLPDLSERMHRIKLARWAGVTPDWFGQVEPQWEDAAAVGMLLEASIAQGPDTEPL